MTRIEKVKISTSKIVLSIVFGFLLNYFSIILKSEFLSKFSENLLIILISLLAINIASVGIIISKLKDLSEKYQFDFSKSYKSLEYSLIEQVILIIISVIFLILKFSIVVMVYFENSEYVVNSVLTSIFIYTLYILHDTGKGLFLITNFKDTNTK